MSYKIKDFTPILDNDKLDVVNFSSDSGKITNVYLKKEEQRLFKKLILGKIKNRSGRYQIDGVDVINKSFVKRHTEYIKPDSWFERLIPTKWILVFSLFFDINFLRKTRIKHAEKKYDYLSLMDSKNDLSDLRVRKDIDQAIDKFLEFTKNNQTKIYQDLVIQIETMNFSKAEKIFNDFSPQIKVLSKAIFDLELEERLSKIWLKFNQVIFDQISLVNDLRDSCTCEYNAKKSKNKMLRKKNHLFNFSQTKYIAAKQLKFLAITLNEIRLKNIKTTYRKKALQKQLRFELKKFYSTYSVSKETQQNIASELGIWKKIIHDKFSDQSKNENIFLFDFIKNETKLLTKFIVSTIHDYHKLIFTAEIEYGNKNEFLVLKRHYKKQIVPVFKQGIDWMESNVKKLDLNFEWFLKGSFKLSSLNMIYAKILKAINLGKNNIVLSDFLHLLTNKDFDALMDAIKKVNKHYPEVTFIILHSRIKTISNLNPKIKIYAIVDKEMIQTTNSSLLALQAKHIFNDEFSNANVLRYIKNSNEIIEIEDRLWNLNASKMPILGTILINPVEITTQFIEDKALPINVKILRSSKFNDHNIHYGVTKNKSRIYFYDNKKNYEREKEAVIYLQPKAIISVKEKEKRNE